MAEIIGDHSRTVSAEERVWWDEARNLITCILSHVVCSPHEIKPANRLPALRSLLLKPASAIQAELARILGESLSVLARVLALGLLAYESDDEFAAIRATAIGQALWLFSVDGNTRAHPIHHSG